MANKYKDKVSNTLTNFYDKINSSDEKTGALLFTNATTDNKFGQIYLFSQFGINTGNSFQKKSQITTHYTEENNAINDHWAIEPIQYSLSGLIGEIIYRPSKTWANKVESTIKNYVQPLSVLSPTFDSYTQSVVNLSQAIEESYKRYEQTAKKALRSIGIGENVATCNQKKVAEELNKLVDNRQLIRIYTPYGELSNMAIVSVNINQENSKFQSTLEITLQEWKETASETREATEHEKSELAKIQSAVTSSLGQASTVDEDVNKTLASRILGVGGVRR